MARALQFCFSSTPHSRVDHILLAGGSAALPGLAQAVTEQTGFACDVVNPFAGMGVAESVRQSRLASEAPAYLTACGLALRRFLS